MWHRIKEVGDSGYSKDNKLYHSGEDCGHWLNGESLADSLKVYNGGYPHYIDVQNSEHQKKRAGEMTQSLKSLSPRTRARVQISRSQ